VESTGGKTVDTKEWNVTGRPEAAEEKMRGKMRKRRGDSFVCLCSVKSLFLKVTRNLPPGNKPNAKP
jgi:hypothetical protein